MMPHSPAPLQGALGSYSILRGFNVKEPMRLCPTCAPNSTDGKIIN